MRRSMRKSLAVIAIFAGPIGFLGAGTEFLSSDPNITVSAFLVLFALLSIALGVVVWRQEGDIQWYAPLLFTAGIAGAVIGMALIVLALS